MYIFIEPNRAIKWQPMMSCVQKIKAMPLWACIYKHCCITYLWKSLYKCTEYPHTEQNAINIQSNWPLMLFHISQLHGVRSERLKVERRNKILHSEAMKQAVRQVVTEAAKDAMLAIVEISKGSRRPMTGPENKAQEMLWQQEPADPH